jgi:hypothetical protein
LNIWLKRRQPQAYPLLPSVAEALARYIDIIRPPTPYPEVFIGGDRRIVQYRVRVIYRLNLRISNTYIFCPAYFWL